MQARPFVTSDRQRRALPGGLTLLGPGLSELMKRVSGAEMRLMANAVLTSRHLVIVT